MATKSNDFATILKEQIKNYGHKVETEEIGVVVTLGDGIAQASGLTKVELGEILVFSNGVFGMALSLEEDFVGIALMGRAMGLREGDTVKRTTKVISIPVGDALIGRVVNALGLPIDDKGKIETKNSRPMFRTAPGVMTRQSVDEPLETGIIAIDAMIPIGKGQRELIIGDRQTGKTAIAIDTIINQRGKQVYCVYVAIGQKNSSIAQIVEKLNRFGAMDYTTIVIANASDPSPLQYIAPYAGISIAEEWMEQGKDVLVVYDDLSKHAVAYRTLALLLRRPPGREAYPGDVFYLHSQLLERAARVNKENGGGSITALPIIETQAGDISAYIPTNVISITDGQIFMMSDLFNAGQRPAIDAGYSVSRVGSTAQIKAMKQASSSLKLELAQYNDMAAFAQFGSDLDESTKQILSHGKKVLEILKQPQYSPLNQVEQVIILLAARERLINPVPVEDIHNFKQSVINHFHTNTHASTLLKRLDVEKSLSEELKHQILMEVHDFIKSFLHGIPNYNAKDHKPLPTIAPLKEKSS